MRRGKRNVHGSRGITLIEVLISMFLITTILLVSLTASANLRRNDRDRQSSRHADALAAIFLDEISAMEFRDPIDPTFGLESDEDVSDRQTLDDVDDYHGYTQQTPTFRDGASIGSYVDWKVAVQVYPASPTIDGVVRTSDLGAPLRLTVIECTAPTGELFTTGRLISHVPYDIAPTTSYERWRRFRVSFPARQIDVSVPLRNKPEPTP